MHAIKAATRPNLCTYAWLTHIFFTALSKTYATHIYSKIVAYCLFCSAFFIIQHHRCRRPQCTYLHVVCTPPYITRRCLSMHIYFPNGVKKSILHANSWVKRRYKTPVKWNLDNMTREEMGKNYLFVSVEIPIWKKLTLDIYEALGEKNIFRSDSFKSIEDSFCVYFWFTLGSQDHFTEPFIFKWKLSLEHFSPVSFFLLISKKIYTIYIHMRQETVLYCIYIFHIYIKYKFLVDV